MSTGIDMDQRLARARALSEANHGPELGCHVPGMFVYDGRRGRFPALSITGAQCSLNCGHCQGKLLVPMTAATSPGDLIAAAERAWARGSLGILVSGGCDEKGRLPFERFSDALARIKDRTGLKVAVHTGFADHTQARALKNAGVDLVMMDVIGDPDTLRQVYNLDSPDAPADTLAALIEAGLETAPHLVVGLDHGRLKGERRAVEIIAASGAGRIVFVVFMPLTGTPLAGCSPPEVDEVIDLMIDARLDYPDLIHNLGCAKPRGKYHRRLDKLAVRAGVNHIAIPAPEAVDLAQELGRPLMWTETCCTVGRQAEADIEMPTGGERIAPAAE